VLCHEHPVEFARCLYIALDFSFGESSQMHPVVTVHRDTFG
jgi:hypothetical protein